MRNTISAVQKTAIVAGFLAAGALAGIMPAAAGAAFAAQDRIIADFCNAYPGASACNDWRYNRDRWSNDQYQAFYRAHRNEGGFDTAAAATAFGMTGTGPTADMTVVSPAANDPSVSATDPNWQIGVQTGNVEGDRAEVIGDSTDHVGDCLATFKSYNVSTDSYQAFDGTTHRCKL